jgi:Holliday junction resolvasome RuvABC endonuclease subunit
MDEKITTSQEELLKRIQRKETRVRRKREKTQDGKEHVERVLKQAESVNVVAAIDMSQKSPGLCVIERGTNRCRMISMQRRQEHTKAEYLRELAKEREMKTIHGFTLSTSIELLTATYEETEGEKSVEQTRRFEDMANKFIKILNDYPVHDLFVVVEGYAYKKQRGGLGSASVTGLAEITGLMKSKLLTQHIQFDVVPPTTIKKWFTKGNADKSQMYATFHQMQQGIDLETLIPRYGSKKADIPSPQQDLVDSFADAYALFRGSALLQQARKPKSKPKVASKPKPKPKPKRKRDSNVMINPEGSVITNPEAETIQKTEANMPALKKRKVGK